MNILTITVGQYFFCPYSIFCLPYIFHYVNFNIIKLSEKESAQQDNVKMFFVVALQAEKIVDACRGNPE